MNTSNSDVQHAASAPHAWSAGLDPRLVIVLRENQLDDRRVVLCRLSDKGHELTSGLWSSARDRIKKLLEAVDPSQLTLLASVLEALSQAGIVTKEDLQLKAD